MEGYDEAPHLLLFLRMALPSIRVGMFLIQIESKASCGRQCPFLVRDKHTNPVFVLNLAELVHIVGPLKFCALGASQTFRQVDCQGRADTCVVCISFVYTYAPL